MHGYADWVRKKHGIAMNVSFGFLLMTVSIPLLIILRKPGEYPLMELMVGILVPVVIAIVAWDNYKFWREIYGKRR